MCASLDMVSYQLSKLSAKWSTAGKSPRTDTLQILSGNHCMDEGLQLTRKMAEAHQSSNSTKPRESQAPEMYKAALMYDWGTAVHQAITKPMEATYIHGADGSTVLHLAIILQASYASCTTTDGQSIRDLWNECKAPAPLKAIRMLLHANLNALKLRCNKLGYMPLVYALLASRDADNEAEKLVQLLIECGRDSLSIPTTEGLSPLEVHIKSFSQVHGSLQFSIDEEVKVRRSTNILHLLLEADPCWTCRESPSQTEGDHFLLQGWPLEVLYECNALALLDAVNCASISSGRDNSLSMSDLNGWWVWHWLNLMLKHSAAHVWI